MTVFFHAGTFDPKERVRLASIVRVLFKDGKEAYFLCPHDISMLNVITQFYKDSPELMELISTATIEAIDLSSYFTPEDY